MRHSISWHLLNARHVSPYFTNKEAKVPRGDVLCPGTHNWRVLSWPLNTDPPRFFHNTTQTCSRNRDISITVKRPQTQLLFFSDSEKVARSRVLSVCPRSCGTAVMTGPLGTHMSRSHWASLALLSNGGTGGGFRCISFSWAESEDKRMLG